MVIVEYSKSNETISSIVHGRLNNRSYVLIGHSLCLPADSDLGMLASDARFVRYSCKITNTIVIFYHIEPRNDVGACIDSGQPLSSYSMDHQRHSNMFAVSNLAICLRLICCFESRMVSVLYLFEDCLALPQLSLLSQASLGKQHEDATDWLKSNRVRVITEMLTNLWVRMAPRKVLLGFKRWELQ